FLFPFLPLMFLFSFQPLPPTEFYTLSLHDALPISPLAVPTWRRLRLIYGLRLGRSVTSSGSGSCLRRRICTRGSCCPVTSKCGSDRKSTRLNSSHRTISYAVFCLKKKKKKKDRTII